MSRTDTFFALSSDRPEGTPYQQFVYDLGDLVLPSGRLEASDPFVNLGSGRVIAVPPGTYPVRVTVADVSDEQDGSHLREAYLSVVLRDGVVSRVAHLKPEGATEGEPSDDGYYGVPVDAGTVAFADSDAVASCMPAGNWYDNLFDGGDNSWFDQMDSPEHLRAGCANIVMPLATAGENVVLAHSGWGDGYYPVLGTYDQDGNLLGVHIDLEVAGEEDTEDDEDDEDDETE